jgi:hypothetical protein
MLLHGWHAKWPVYDIPPSAWLLGRLLQLQVEGSSCFMHMGVLQGNMVLKAPFKPQVKELVVVPYQVALLMLFNEADELTFVEIRDRLKLTDDETLRTLASLACSKHAILLVDGADPKKRPKKVNKTDKFRVNWNFQDKLVRYDCHSPERMNLHASLLQDS